VREGNVNRALLFFEVLSRIPGESTVEDINAAHHEAESAEIIIGPDKTFPLPTMRCRHDFTREHAEQMRAGKASLYCYGLFTYLDIFMRTHTTKFCRRYDVGFGEWVPEGGKERNFGD
jgi:hypothetical protein